MYTVHVLDRVTELLIQSICGCAINGTHPQSTNLWSKEEILVSVLIPRKENSGLRTVVCCNSIQLILSILADYKMSVDQGLLRTRVCQEQAGYVDTRHIDFMEMTSDLFRFPFIPLTPLVNDRQR